MLVASQEWRNTIRAGRVVTRLASWSATLGPVANLYPLRPAHY